jgi:hypothetical protein
MVTVYLFDYPNTCKYIWSHYMHRFTILYQWKIQVEIGFMLEHNNMHFKFKYHILRNSWSKVKCDHLGKFLFSLNIVWCHWECYSVSFKMRVNLLNLRLSQWWLYRIDYSGLKHCVIWGPPMFQRDTLPSSSGSKRKPKINSKHSEPGVI